MLTKQNNLGYNLGMDRVILHCDLNNFYASVECVQNPLLWSKPMAVAGNPRTRHGIVLAKNQIAKNMGIKTGHTIWEAKRICPTLICLPPNHDLYQKYSLTVREIYKRFTDRVESFGPDECWLDVTNSQLLFGDGEKIANTLREIVKKETGLTISVGVSFSKYFAKLGSDLKKPDATTVISKENFRSKIWNLPADSLIFVGKKTIDKLNKLNIFSIGDLAKADEKMLTDHFGVLGKKYKQIANGTDNEPVQTEENLGKTKSVGNGTTTIRDLTNRDEIETTVLTLAEKVAYRMRQHNLVGRTATLSLRDETLKFTSHSLTFSPSTSNANFITTKCMEIFDKFWNNTKLSIRSVRIAISNLNQAGDNIQIDMFNTKKLDKVKKLDESLDKIREKYGYYAVRPAKTLSKDFIDYFEADEENEDNEG